MGRSKSGWRWRGLWLVGMVTAMPLLGWAVGKPKLAPGRQKSVAAFARGMANAKKGRVAEATAALEEAVQFEPIRDAATAELVQLLYQHHEWQAVLEAAGRYPIKPDDVFYHRIASDAAHAASNAGLWPDVLQWTEHLESDPAAIYLRAAAEEKSGNAREAGKLERDLVYLHPTTWSGKHALPSWHRHLKAMPDLKPGWKLIARRATALDRAREHRTAAVDWTWAAREAPAKAKPDLEMAAARSYRHDGQFAKARRLLRTLLRGPVRDQALELEIELAQANGTQRDFSAPLAALAKEFPHSRWYALALDQAGSSAIIAADGAAIQRYFDPLVKAFPNSSFAPAAAWHAAWVAYRTNQPNAPQRLERYAKDYPTAEEAVDALYWRGMWAEKHGDHGLAQLYFRAAATRFPGKYFGQQARLRWQRKSKASDYPTGEPPGWLAAYLHDGPSPVAQRLTGDARKDAERAGWLSAAGLNQPAATILKAALRQLAPGEAALTVARQLARIEDEENNWYGGIVAMVHGLPNYLELKQGELPANDWKMLFPSPYSHDIKAAAKREGVDPNLLRALIRQESGFNPQATSGVSALGLMQLMPATARGLGGRHLRVSDLFKPALNIRLGSRFFRHLLSRFQEPAYALAGYNAGGSRVVQWRQTYNPDGVNEFIESIPFSETRSYVKAVLRNQAHYAAIYGH